MTNDKRMIEVRTPTYERPDVRKDVSGYYNRTPLDAIDLFIGSEGTLGVITEIELQLLNKPKGFSGVVFFATNRTCLHLLLKRYLPFLSERDPSFASASFFQSERYIGAGRRC